MLGTHSIFKYKQLENVFEGETVGNFCFLDISFVIVNGSKVGRVYFSMECKFK